MEKFVEEKKEVSFVTKPYEIAVLDRTENVMRMEEIANPKVKLADKDKKNRIQELFVQQLTQEYNTIVAVSPFQEENKLQVGDKVKFRGDAEFIRITENKQSYLIISVNYINIIHKDSPSVQSVFNKHEK